VTRALAIELSDDLMWVAAFGAGAFAATLTAPFVHRLRMRRHAARLAARAHRGYDRYYEELRELEAWPPQGRAAFDGKTVVAATLVAIWAGLFVYAWRRPEAEYLMSASMLVMAAAGLGRACWESIGIWRDAQADPRSTIMSPKRGDPVASAKVRTMWRRIGQTLSLAAISFMLAALSARSVLDMLK
jgi:hypothetical protein